MASKKKSRKARAGAPMCDCPSTAARKAFKNAKTCAAKSRAFDVIKRLASEDEKTLKPGRRALLFRDLLKKQTQVNSTCSAEEASDSSRFNGLGRVRSRRRRRARR